MKTKQIISIIAASAIIGTAVFSSSAIEHKNILHCEAAASYDSPELAEYAEQVAALVNRERKANGLQPVKFSPLLSEAANVRSAELKESFSHTRPNGTSCFTVLKEFGISYYSAAENIAYGQRTPEIVMNGWMNSSGHRANILSNNVEYIGVGVVYRNGIYYWTQLFAASDDLADDAYLPDKDTEKPAVTTTVSKITIPTTTTTVAITTTKSTVTKQTVSVSTSKKTDTIKTTTSKLPVSTQAESVTVTQTTAEKETTSTCCTESTTNCTDISKPTFTLPNLNDYFDNGKFIVISPEQFNLDEFLHDNNFCKDKCCERAENDFSELYPELKKKIFDKLFRKG